MLVQQKFIQILRNVMVLGFGGCFAGSVGYDKGNAGVDEEALTRMSDEIKTSSEKCKIDEHVGYLYIPNILCCPVSVQVYM